MMRQRLRRLLVAVVRYDQPPLDYCPNCGGNYPPGHFPCN